MSWKPTLLLAAMAASLAACASDDTYPTMRFAGDTAYGVPYRDAPPLDPSRRIVKRDCTQPVPAEGPNLVCE